MATTPHESELPEPVPIFLLLSPAAHTTHASYPEEVQLEYDWGRGMGEDSA